MRINRITMPNIEEESPEQAVKMLHEFCHEMTGLVIKINNEVEDLKKTLELVANKRN